MSGYALSYVALVARDTAAVCRFLGDSLNLPRRDLSVNGDSVSFFGVGQTALGVFEPGNAYLDEPVFPGVHHLALASERPLETARVHGFTVEETGHGPIGKTFVRLDAEATCGIRTRFIEPLGIAGVGAKVERIDHLGIASTDNARCIEVFSTNLGCAVESAQTDIELRQVTESFISDKYGAVYHARTPEILGGLRGLFISVGDCELEIMQDYDSALAPRARLGEAAGNTKGDQSAIARFVARRGPGLAHLAFATPDIDETLADLDAQGWRLIDKTGRPGGRGSRIGFVHPGSFGGGLLIHFVEPGPPEPA